MSRRDEAELVMTIARRKGVEFQTNGRRLSYEPRERVSARTRDLINELSGEIIAILRSEEKTDGG